MNILDQAMALEQQGEALYRSFANEASDEGTVYIFSRLADQEKKHYGILSNMKEAAPVLDEKEVALKSIRDIFEGWRGNKAPLNVKPSQVELYRKALDVEEKSVRLYEEGADKATDDKIQAVFLRIAAEEKRHREVLENIIEFVTKPDVWSENAEFGYRGKDYYL